MLLKDKPADYKQTKQKHNPTGGVMFLLGLFMVGWFVSQQHHCFALRPRYMSRTDVCRRVGSGGRVESCSAIFMDKL